MSEFWIFAAVGFVAQLIDGTLGLGFGIISASVLLGQGFAPPLVSAAVNAAKIPTTGTAALSHVFNRNQDWRLVGALSLFGGIGGVLGMLLLTSLKGKALTVLVTAYMFLIGGLIVARGVRGVAPRVLPSAHARLIGLVGGFVEGIGGSWGPIVTTSLMGAGTQSRYAIGSSNVSEFLVSIMVFTAYLAAFAVGHWQGGSDWHTVFLPVLGLVIGGFPAALAGGWLSRVAPNRALTVAVGMLAVGIALYRLFFAT